jgi:hypothetical protein
MGKNLEVLDMVLVPAGVAILVAYQAQLVYRVRRRPHTTVLGINHINRRAWVRVMMKVKCRDNVIYILRRV